jgi:hypothetical protein
MNRDEVLIGTALRNLQHNYHKSRYRGVIFWGLVSDIFGLGSTSSIELCQRYGIDPWLKLGMSRR